MPSSVLTLSEHDNATVSLSGIESQIHDYAVLRALRMNADCELRPSSFPQDSAGALLHAKHAWSFLLGWYALHHSDIRTGAFAMLGPHGQLAAVGPGLSTRFYAHDLWLCTAHPTIVRARLGLGPFEANFDVDVEVKGRSSQVRRYATSPSPLHEATEDPVVRSTLDSEEVSLPNVEGHPGDAIDREYISSCNDLPSWPPSPERAAIELPGTDEVEAGLEDEEDATASEDGESEEMADSSSRNEEVHKSSVIEELDPLRDEFSGKTK